MKVFLSWSGTKSHKIALVFRDWLPAVIQEIVPYVSSEDIDKGARWSTDIAKELADSTFGILCVTRENINAPWLTFEAGALSKTMEKAYVSPFLFDIKRSEVDGPILQFQSTIFEKEDLKKLIRTLNKACDKNGLTPERLEKAFDVWYPTLETELEKLRGTEPDDQKEVGTTELETPKAQEILEEILELSRINQKLIRNPDGAFGENLMQIDARLRELLDRVERGDNLMSNRRMQKFSPMVMEEFVHMSMSEANGYIGIQMLLAFFRNQFPWIYDIGNETIKILRSRRAKEEKYQAIQVFERTLNITVEHPAMREYLDINRKEYRYFIREIPHFLMQALERN